MEHGVEFGSFVMTIWSSTWCLSRVFPSYIVFDNDASFGYTMGQMVVFEGGFYGWSPSWSLN